MVDYICTKCHYIGKPRKTKRGSGKTEFWAWMVFPLGLPYTFWRMLTKINTCRHCDDHFLIATNSPTGKKLLEIMDAGIATIKPIDAPAKKTSIEQKLESTKSEKPKLPTHQQDPNVW